MMDKETLRRVVSTMRKMRAENPHMDVTCVGGIVKARLRCELIFRVDCYSKPTTTTTNESNHAQNAPQLH